MFRLVAGGAVVHEDPLSSVLDDVLSESAAAMAPVPAAHASRLVVAPDAPTLPFEHLRVLTVGPVPRHQQWRMPQEGT